MTWEMERNEEGNIPDGVTTFSKAQRVQEERASGGGHRKCEAMWSCRGWGVKFVVGRHTVAQIAGWGLILQVASVADFIPCNGEPLNVAVT